MLVPHLTLLSGRYAICRLDAGEAIPHWAQDTNFSAITRTPSELSIVCLQGCVPEAVRAEREWRGLQLAGPLSFDQVGVIAGISAVLAGAGVPLFVISTYETDYVFIKDSMLASAARALDAAGYSLDLSAGD